MRWILTSYKYVLDSYAWMELFLGTSQGKKVEHLLKENTATSVVAIAELSDKCHREQQSFEPYLEFIQKNAALTALTVDIAREAGKVKTELRKISKNISLAGSIHFQTAKTLGATLVTGDSDFKEVKGILFLD